MSKTLPSGYTQVEYIQSSGTQYIDTGFKPNQDTRVVMYGYNESSNSAWIYGAWNSANSGAFAYLSVNRYYMYGSQQINANSISTGEFTLDHKKNSFTLNGTTISGDSETFTCNYSLYLFALNVGGSVSSGKLTGKLYSCEIYDNGTLVRDYVPCKNPDGIIGLYDLVNDTFYVNAGTATFSAGETVTEYNPYTELEYIESSGTQYIDTNTKPNQNFRTILDVENLKNGNAALFGVRDTANTNGYLLWAISSTQFRSDFYASTGNTNAMVYGTVDTVAGRYIIDKNKSVCNIKNITINNNSDISFSCNQTMLLFSLSSDGIANTAMAEMKLYSCLIYDDDVLVRDYVPYKKASGTVGLYDLVNDTFYVSSGTEDFIAGAEKTTIPTTPKNIKANITEGVLNLTWDETSSATGYKVEKYGYFQTQTETNIYTESIEPYTFFTYLVSAFNENGQSEYASIEVYHSNDNVVLDLITDRTQADVSRAKTLASKIWTKMTDEEKSEFLSNMKGAYNASDFNRVEEAVSYIANRLIQAGYEPYDTLGEKVYRKTGDIPIPSQIETYLDKVGIIKNSMPNFPTTPNTPIFKGKTFTYEEANDIEKILIDIDKVITLAEYVPYYSGDIFAGEV